MAIDRLAGQDASTCCGWKCLRWRADSAEGAFLQRGSRRQHRTGRQLRFGSVQPDHRHRHRTVLRPERRHRRQSSASPTRSTFCCSAKTSTWPHPSRRWKASACWKPWPSRTSWRSTARRPASWPAASFRSRWFSRGANGNAVSITFREFGIRIHFLPQDHAARHHSTAGCPGSQLAGLRQRRDHFRHYRSRP